MKRYREDIIHERKAGLPRSYPIGGLRAAGIESVISKSVIGRNIVSRTNRTELCVFVQLMCHTLLVEIRADITVHSVNKHLRRMTLSANLT